MKRRYNSHCWRRDVLFPLVTFAVCGWLGRSRDTFSASGGPLIRLQRRPQVSPGWKWGGRSSGRDGWNSGFLVVFSRGVSVHPVTHCRLSPSSTPPRGKQMKKGFSLPNRAVGFQSSSHRFVNPYLISWGNGRAVNRHVQSHGF